jgi:hypothetical protein
MSTSVPTDLKILQAIYDGYHEAFGEFAKGGGSRSTKIYVPIDIERIARDLRVDGDLVFGRLYYHLEHKYGYKQTDGTSVHFFALRIGDDVHCVNFPFMAAVLADLQDQSRKHNWALWIAVASLIVSAVSVAIAVLLKQQS